MLLRHLCNYTETKWLLLWYSYARHCNSSIYLFLLAETLGESSMVRLREMLSADPDLRCLSSQDDLTVKTLEHSRNVLSYLHHAFLYNLVPSPIDCEYWFHGGRCKCDRIFSFLSFFFRIFLIKIHLNTFQRHNWTGKYRVRWSRMIFCNFGCEDS